MKTLIPKVKEIKHEWVLIDAKDQVLGRLASVIAKRLRGKHKPDFTPHLNTGDYVVVINADKVKLTGKKWDNKLYYKHTGYLGHLKTFTAKEMLKRHPENLIKLAVKRMLPKNKLGAKLLKKLKIYTGTEHPHQAQMPKPIPINYK